MKNIVTYEQFINEGFIGGIKNALNKAWNYITNLFGEHSWLYMAVYLEKKQAYKGKITVYCNSLSQSEQAAAINKIDAIVKAPDAAVKKEADKLSQEEITQEKLRSLNLKYMMTEKVVKLEHPNPKVLNVDSEQLRQRIKMAYKLKVKRNELSSLFIWGAPGIGKTEIVKQVADELGIDLIVWHLSTIEPSDFLGIPKIVSIADGEEVDEETPGAVERTVFRLPSIFPTSNGKNDKGLILFFDELNRAKGPVLSASLQLTLEGQVGTYKIPSKCVIVAAGNRKEDVGGDVREIEGALANRFTHVNLVPKFEDWLKWAMVEKWKAGEGVDPSVVGQRKVHPDVISFLSMHKEFFHKFDDEKEELGWPSPRSWVKASIEYTEELESGGGRTKEDIKNIFAGKVGLEAAVEFASYVEMARSYPVEGLKAVYEHPEDAPALPKEPDKARAAIASIAFYKKDEKLTDKQLSNVFDYMFLKIVNVEIASSLVGWVKIVHPEIKDQQIWADLTKKWVRKYKKELGAENVKDM